MRRAGIFFKRIETAGRGQRRWQARAAVRARFGNGKVGHSFPQAERRHDHPGDGNGADYNIEEIKALSAVCRELGLRLHMDGARFANACATLECAPAELTWKVGVDVLCFGGTKNGMAVGEAILFFDRRLAEDFEYRCKQAGQLASKMRFLAAPWLGMLESGAWLANAAHGNACARRLEAGIKGIPGVAPMFPVEANSVFLSASPAVLEGLRQRGWRFYTFIGGGRAFHVRLGRRSRPRRCAGRRHKGFGACRVPVPVRHSQRSSAIRSIGG